MLETNYLTATTLHAAGVPESTDFGAAVTSNESDSNVAVKASRDLTANHSHIAALPRISPVRCVSCGPGLDTFDLRARLLHHFDQDFPGLTLTAYLPQEGDAGATHPLSSFQAIWQTKSKPDYLKNVIFNAETKRERVTMDFPGQDKRSVFEPNRVEMLRRAGTVVATRDDPEASFQGQEQFTPWDDLDVGYFSGEALYTYFNTPFLCTYDEFSSEKFLPFKLTPGPGAA